MPSWIKNDDKWQKAEEIVAKERGKSKEDFTDSDWAYVTGVYKRMGGKVQKSLTQDDIIDAFSNTFRRFITIQELQEKAKAYLSPDKRFTVAVDFDGVIVSYDGWKGEGVFGSPMPGVQVAMKILRSLGALIIIFTTRSEVDAIAEYCQGNGIEYDFINRNPYQPAGLSGKIMADVYLDDRALRFDNWNDALNDVTSLMAARG